MAFHPQENGISSAFTQIAENLAYKKIGDN